MSEQELDEIEKAAAAISESAGDWSVLRLNPQFGVFNEFDDVDAENRLPTIVVLGARQLLDPDLGEHRRRAARNATVSVVNAELEENYAFLDIQQETLKWAFGSNTQVVDDKLDKIIDKVDASFSEEASVSVQKVGFGRPNGVRLNTTFLALVMIIGNAIEKE